MTFNDQQFDAECDVYDDDDVVDDGDDDKDDSWTVEVGI